MPEPTGTLAALAASAYPRACGRRANIRSNVPSVGMGGPPPWGVPTRKELLTLVDPLRTNPTLDPSAFYNAPADWFWTSTPVARSDTSAHWAVSFADGASSARADTLLARARCVY